MKSAEETKKVYLDLVGMLQHNLCSGIAPRGMLWHNKQMMKTLCTEKS